jgi:hypothetical protein
VHSTKQPLRADLLAIPAFHRIGAPAARRPGLP